LVNVCDGWQVNEFAAASLDCAGGVHGKKLVPKTDWLLDLPAVRREFRGLRFANFADDARRAACARLAHFDLDPAKRGGLLDLPFPHAERAGEVTDGQSSGVPRQNVLDTVKTFAAEGGRTHEGNIL
jgi:hypothetical protein